MKWDGDVEGCFCWFCLVEIGVWARLIVNED